MERKKSKYIGDNKLLYIQNPEKTKQNKTNKKKKKNKVLQVIKSLQNTR